MQPCDTCRDIAIQPAQCASALFVAAMALDLRCGGYTWLPKIMLPTEWLVRCNCCGNLTLVAPDDHCLLGVVPPQDDFRP